VKFFLVSIAGICVWLSLAQAATDSKLKLVGYVRSFDAQNIVVDSGNQRYTIPRSHFPEATKAGELVSVSVTQEEFSSFKHTTSVKQ
jgi:hypothetical protein